MTADLIPWIVAGVGLAAAVVFFFRLRTTLLQASSRQLEAEKLYGELQATRKQLEKSSAKERRSSDELTELRRRLEKAKRRAAAAAGGPRNAAPSRIEEIEAELEQTRQARDAAREEAAGLSSELSRLRAELAATAPPEPLLDNEGIEALQRRAEQTEAKLAPLEQELAKARKTGERLRGKVRTQESLYLAMRGELEAKKDRLRTQQEELERLQAFKVAVVDPIPPPPDTGAEGSPSEQADDVVTGDEGGEPEAAPASATTPS